MSKLAQLPHLLLILGLVCVLRIPISTVSSSEFPEHTAQSGLRGVFFATGTKEGKGVRVGRLAIEFIGNAGESTVRADHTFRSGDRFRFEVSSNRDGWLYILHRSGQDDPGLLWPRISEAKPGEHLDNNRILAGQTTTLPQAPGRFVFDRQSGEETFYVLISSERTVPRLSAVQGQTATSVHSETKAPGQNRIVNFAVRGGGNRTQNLLRGVVFDPGKEDGDPYLYFSTPSASDQQPVLLEFQLTHQ